MIKRLLLISFLGVLFVIMNCNRESPIVVKEMNGPSLVARGDFDQPFRKIAVARPTVMPNYSCLYTFAIADNNQLYYKFQFNPGPLETYCPEQQEYADKMFPTWPEYAGWVSEGAPSGTTLKAALAAGCHSSGYIYVFSAKTSDSKLVCKQQVAISPPGFTSWTTIGNHAVSGDLVVGNYNDGTIAVFYKSSTDSFFVKHLKANNSWDASVKIGNEKIGSKFTVVNGPDGRMVAYMSKNGYLYSIKQNANGSWPSGSWTRISNISNVDNNADIQAILNNNQIEVFYISANEIWNLVGTTKTKIVSSADGGAYRRLCAGKRGDGANNLVLMYAVYNNSGDYQLQIVQKVNGMWEQPNIYPAGGSIVRSRINENNLACCNLGSTNYPTISFWSINNVHGYGARVTYYVTWCGGQARWPLIWFDAGDWPECDME